MIYSSYLTWANCTKFANNVLLETILCVSRNVVTPPNPRVGFLPVLRGGLDGSQLWTMVQTEGFATAG